MPHTKHAVTPPAEERERLTKLVHRVTRAWPSVPTAATWRGATRTAESSCGERQPWGANPGGPARCALRSDRRMAL